MIQVVKNEEEFYRQSQWDKPAAPAGPGRGTVWAKAWRWERTAWAEEGKVWFGLGGGGTGSREGVTWI